ncbi:MAG: hypothetical protein ACJA08_001617 [Cyclobacteriaceae bacterium]|jgi:hypothetical protein
MKFGIGTGLKNLRILRIAPIWVKAYVTGQVLNVDVDKVLS